MIGKHMSKEVIRSFLVLTLLFLFTIFYILLGSSPILAKVTGECVNCHTMHNSQGGADMATFGGETGPNNALTRGSCVGCHSNTTSDTIKVLGSSRIPVVYNTVPPVKELAGGNFYWVITNGMEYGHNVLSIPDMPSDELTKAPGIPLSADDPTCGGCHRKIDDCTSCHMPAHHADDSTPIVGETGGWYRFLDPGSYFHDGAGGVEGLEELDWEQTKDELKHNEYKGGVLTSSGGHGVDKSMSDYCAGCHQKFHDTDFVGTSSPWLRHPNNYALPADTDKEYYLYNTQDGGSTKGPYNPEAPVARPVLTGYTEPSSTVTPGTDQVFCLSCHRPHGTPYKDILRWAYDPDDGGVIEAGTTGAGAGTGCFICHTTKDGI